MSLELDYNTADFRSLSPREQISKCREMAREALRLATLGSVEMCGEYSDLATRWLALAAEMERSTIGDDYPTWRIGERVCRKDSAELGTVAVLLPNGNVKVKWDDGATSYFKRGEPCHVRKWR